MSLLVFLWGLSTDIYLPFMRKMKFKRRLKNYVSKSLKYFITFHRELLAWTFRNSGIPNVGRRLRIRVFLLERSLRCSKHQWLYRGVVSRPTIKTAHYNRTYKCAEWSIRKFFWEDLDLGYDKDSVSFDKFLWDVSCSFHFWLTLFLRQCNLRKWCIFGDKALWTDGLRRKRHNNWCTYFRLALYGLLWYIKGKCLVHLRLVLKNVEVLRTSSWHS